MVEIASSDVVIVSAIHKIKSNQGNSTAGTDGKTISDILTLNYDEAINFVKRCFKKYTPNPIRRVHIPKPGKRKETFRHSDDRRPNNPRMCEDGH
ncbi:hypothetical protein DI43_05260 [Geobacillus sp. CAMR12739]|nr:hypothetical protein DI43_05260 [Geobacillus sp. CAMR12739]